MFQTLAVVTILVCTTVSIHLRPNPTVDASSITINNAGIDIHYRKYGSGHPPYLLFQHGFPDRETTWTTFQVPFFSSSYTIITPTLRGFPPSDVPKDVGAYTSVNYTSDIIAILDHEHIHNISLIGHDFGGGIVQYVAQAHPGRVSALIILNAPIIPVFLPLIEYDAEEQYFARYTIPYYSYEPGQPKNVSTIVEHILNATYRAEIAAYLEASPLYGMLDFYKNNYPGPPYGQNLSALQSTFIQKMPTLLLWGKDDPYFSPKLIDGLESWFELGIRLVTVPKAGHWVFRDQWKRANEEIASFLALVDGIAGSFV